MDFILSNSFSLGELKAVCGLDGIFKSYCRFVESPVKLRERHLVKIGQ